jgi:hypothetical protein
MRECTACNYSSETGVCLHESARDASGTGPNLSMRENRAMMDTLHCGREGRFWQPRAVAMPSEPNAA